MIEPLANAIRGSEEVGAGNWEDFMFFRSGKMVKTDHVRSLEEWNSPFTLMRIDVWREPMAEHCFRKKDSNPPLCGVHNVLLVEGEASIDPLAPYLGSVTCLICPISRLVVLD